MLMSFAPFTSLKTLLEISMKTSITLEDIQEQIEKTEVMTIGKKTTVVLITLKNGFEVVGSSACVDAAQYSQEIGQKFAMQRAIDKIWEVEGYHLQKMNHEITDPCAKTQCCQESRAEMNTSDPT